jgi:hypothetical protein
MSRTLLALAVAGSLFAGTAPAQAAAPVVCTMRIGHAQVVYTFTNTDNDINGNWIQTGYSYNGKTSNTHQQVWKLKNSGLTSTSNPDWSIGLGSFNGFATLYHGDRQVGSGHCRF